MQGCVCPHPPLLIPEIGRSHRDEVRATASAMERLATATGERDTIVIVSPHTPTYLERFTVKSAPMLAGDFGAFGCPQVGLEIPNDLAFVEALVAEAESADLQLETVGDDDLDHGILVPMAFLRARSLVSLSIVASYAPHRALGELVRRTAQRLGREVLFVASGDLSHRLAPDSPAGYDSHGAAFDRRIVEILETGDFASLQTLEGSLVSGAGECGLRSLIALGGFLGTDAGRDPHVLSYEGPFGVGYLVAGFGLGIEG